MLTFFRRQKRTRAAVACVALIALDACYSWIPVAGGAAPIVGERIRIVLTPTGIADLTRYLGPNIAVAEGALVSADPDSTLSVAVDFVQSTNGVQQQWAGEGMIRFPAADVATIQRRALQRGRSIAGAAALTVSLLGIAVVALRSGGAGGDGTLPPPPPPP